MYFLIDWPTFLKPYTIEGKDLFISRNFASSHLCVAGQNDISVICSRTQSICIRYYRSIDSIEEYGVNCVVSWRSDSSHIAVGTIKGYILIYAVTGLTNARDERKINSPVVNIEWCTSERKLMLVNAVELPSRIHCFGRLRDDILAGLADGTIMRVRWTGQILTKQTVVLKEIQFYYDLEQSRASRLNDDNAFCTHIDWCASFGGLLIRLSNGRCALLTTSNDRIFMNTSEGIWAENMRSVTCSAANTRFRVFALGSLNGDGAIFSMDETTGALEMQNKLNISTRDYPDAERVTGGVRQMAWSPDGCALVLAWEKGGFSVWSVFGSLLFCSLGETYGSLFTNYELVCLDWGCEGYLLWSVFVEKKEDDTCKDFSRVCVVNFKFAKSPLSNNPNINNQQHLILQTDTHVYINESIVGTKSPDNQHWHVSYLPQTYLKFAWPLRYSCIDESGMHVAVAGTCGLTHYSLTTRKWKLFGNETQESNMEVNGSMCWWHDNICLLCYNNQENKHEIRIYPRTPKLDNAFATILSLPSEGLLLNVFRDILIVFCADSHINLYTMEQVNEKGMVVRLRKLQEIAVTSFIAFPRSVTSISLSSLRSEINLVKTSSPRAEEVESILMNYAGRLLMFQRDWSSYHQLSSTMSTSSGGRKRKYFPFSLCSPNVIASCVEVLWTCAGKDSGAELFDFNNGGLETGLLNDSSAKWLTDALWLNCGSAGMRVWLPLIAQENRAPHFLSRRIMLPFQAEVYTLVVTFEETLLLGAVSELRSNMPSVSATAKEHAFTGMPYALLEKKREIYLHRIVKQLLRKNLGVHALSLSRYYRNKPYFNHCLELLLHEVLEEEASSKEPIPDPLLPRVIAFIQEFPEYLSTVAQCARKTEIALWHYLFSATGNPKDIFESCLMADDLETAAKYLIILQNMEAPVYSKQHAILLLDAALNKSKWPLVCNLIRFLRTIQTSDVLEDGPGMPPIQKRSSRNSFISASSPPVSPHDAICVERKRHESTGGSKISQSQQPPQISPSNSYIGSDEMNTILMRHARRLLKSYRLFDLFSFVANTDFENHQFIAWLRKERCKSGSISDYVEALKSLHQDFHWPMPISKNEVLIPDPSRSFSISHEPKFSFTRQSESPCEEQDVDVSSRTTDVFLDTVDKVSLNSNAHLVGESDTSSIVSDIDSINGRNFEDITPQQYELNLSTVCQEIANKGPQKSEVQLRYLLFIMMEAACYEWCVLISIILRDPVSLNKSFNSVMEAGFQDTRTRVKNGLQTLQMWADSHCLGYSSFLSAIKPNVRLDSSLSVNIPSPPTPPSQTRTTQINSINSPAATCDELNNYGTSQIFETSCELSHVNETSNISSKSELPKSSRSNHVSPLGSKTEGFTNVRTRDNRISSYLVPNESFDDRRLNVMTKDDDEMELVHYETNYSETDNTYRCLLS